MSPSFFNPPLEESEMEWTIRASSHVIVGATARFDDTVGRKTFGSHVTDLIEDPGPFISLLREELNRIHSHQADVP